MDIFERDVSNHYRDFLEPIMLSASTPNQIDPYTKQPINYVNIATQIGVSWSDTIQSEFQMDYRGGSLVGAQIVDDARCIYEGNINLAPYFTAGATITRLKNGNRYSIESLTNPRDGRWIFILRKQK